MFLYIYGEYIGVFMVNKVGYGYNQHTSTHQIRNAERELKKEQAERAKAEAARRKNAYQETFVRGGVVFNTAQVQSCEPAKLKGPDGKNINGYKVEFRNGMVVTFADQTDKKIRNYRYGDVSAIFVHDSDIDVYNVNVGNLQGTSNSENIKLRVCYNFNVDGKGGQDIYTSKQSNELSFNSYVMHAGDVYEKKDFENYDIEDERDAATSDQFTLKDDVEHKKYLEELKKIEVERKERAEARKNEPIFDIQPIEYKFIDQNFRDQVLTRSEDARKKIHEEKVLQKALEFLYNRMAIQMRQFAIQDDPSLAKDIKETEEIENSND